MSEYILVFESNLIAFEIGRWYRMAPGKGWFLLPDGEPKCVGDQLCYDEYGKGTMDKYGKAMFAIHSCDIEKTFAMNSGKQEAAA